ncbi:MAG: hypothetical protein PHD60_09760, partial [Clostridia bacterium]|nr:hypothetical protein [Clostridia bacterium]
LASHYHPVAYVAALFSPLGHELLIYIGQRREKKGEPLYVPTEKGIKLLYVQRGSIFAKIGIKSEDVLLTLNDTQLYCDEDIEEILMEGTNIVRLEYLCKKTGERKKTTIECGDLKSLGYISVPTRHAFPYLYFATSMSLLKKWCKK